MAQANELTGFTKADLQELLEGLATKMKEPTKAEQEKINRDNEAIKAQFKQSAQFAEMEERKRARRWEGCPHAVVYNGRKIHKWVGQVNSDNHVVPVCMLCNVEAPKFSASLLPNGGKDGVNFQEPGAWNWPDDTRGMFLGLHRQSFPQGCGKPDC